MKLLLTNTDLRLRPITLADKEVLCQIYSSTRTEELKLATHWTEEQKLTFLGSQFEAQHNYYQNNYGGAYFWLIEKEGETIGRLYLHPAYGNSVRIIDITLLPQWRNCGIGGQLLKDIIAFAEGRDKSVSIHVESFNPAKKLYERLGFRLVSETNGVYHLMEWKTSQTVLQ
jgi:GNAT superfamily N-acetyltransferase